MARKRVTASKRLAKSIERNKSLASLRNLLRWTGPDPLGTTHEDAVLRKAFKAFGFDPRDPGAWRILLVELAAVHFDKGLPGRRPTWDQDLWRRFKNDVLEVIDILKEKGVFPHDTKVAAYLRKQHPYSERYRHFGEAALCRYMNTSPPKAISAPRKQPRTK